MRLFQEEPHLWEIYNDLCTLQESHLIYEEILENFGIKNVSAYFGNLEFLSSETKRLMYEFEESWNSYQKKTEFSTDAVFVYLDSDFQSILDVELSFFLKSFSEDMKRHGYTDFWKRIMKRKPPSNEQVVERAKILYRLLIKGEIIKKNSLE